jgi:redox-sensitive bicupin YhaK (pirin superfamily)
MFPHAPGQHLDPFVLFDDFAVTPPAGFPEHPHRGFEAFTYMLDGTFHHRDNLGNESSVSSGGVQLFTSGRGARHSEMPGEARPNRGLQLWINLPARLKKMPPAYAAVAPRDVPEETARGVRRRTVVGPGSPVVLQTEVRYLDLALERAARFADEIAQGATALLYVIDGRVRVGDVELSRGEAALPVAGALDVVALAEARFVLLSGRPHGEPIRQRGPYVD